MTGTGDGGEGFNSVEKSAASDEPLTRAPRLAGPPAGAYLLAIFWIFVYLALVLAPLLALLIGPTPPSLGFWWDLSIALGFAATTMMGVQFLLTARFKRATAPYGIDIIYYLHRYLALVALTLIVAHVVLLLIANPAFVDALNPFGTPFYQTAGVVSALAAVLLVVTSLARKAMRFQPGQFAWLTLGRHRRPRVFHLRSRSHDRGRRESSRSARHTGAPLPHGAFRPRLKRGGGGRRSCVRSGRGSWRWSRACS